MSQVNFFGLYKHYLDETAKKLCIITDSIREYCSFLLQSKR